MTVKSLSYKKISCLNPLYFIINKTKDTLTLKMYLLERGRSPVFYDFQFHRNLHLSCKLH